MTECCIQHFFFIIVELDQSQRYVHIMSCQVNDMVYINSVVYIRCGVHTYNNLHGIYYMIWNKHLYGIQTYMVYIPIMLCICTYYVKSGANSF